MRKQTERQTGGETDGRETSMEKLIVAFYNFAYAPKMILLHGFDILDISTILMF
jgi:hypothetical protein